MHGMHMHGIAASPVASMMTASLAGHSAMTTGDPVTHGTDGGPCDATGMQHCAAASVDTVKLAPPPQGHAEGVSHPQQVTAAPVPAHSAGRAPPDLSVLSQLRI